MTDICSFKKSGREKPETLLNKNIIILLHINNLQLLGLYHSFESVEFLEQKLLFFLSTYEHYFYISQYWGEGDQLFLSTNNCRKLAIEKTIEHYNNKHDLQCINQEL